MAQANLANPVLHVDAADPPVWIGHADNDMVVPWTQSQRLYGALQAAAVPSDFVRVGFGGHSLQEVQYALARDFVLARFAEVPSAIFEDGFEAGQQLITQSHCELDHSPARLAPHTGCLYSSLRSNRASA